MEQQQNITEAKPSGATENLSTAPLEPVVRHGSLVQIAYGFLDCDLSDDALIYAGSATWNDWRNHVPEAVRSSWASIDRVGRAAVFLTAKAVTAWHER